MKPQLPNSRSTGPLRPSRGLLRVFQTYLHWYLGRHFRALRVAHASRFPADPRGLIICINHASWWDPLTCMMLARRFLPGAEQYAPMDAAALGRYRFMRHLGLFPVEPGTPRGAAQFLRAATEALHQRRGVLWITPQGAFTDVRTRPIIFHPGLAALTARLPEAVIVPTAIEYTFWDERLPEILVNIGVPVSSVQSRPVTAGELESSLASAQDELATLAAARNPKPFECLLNGTVGTGGIYQLWQRLQAAATGREYHPEHGSIHHS